MGLSELIFCVSVLALGHYHLRMGIATLQTPAFGSLVCGNQAMTYATAGLAFGERVVFVFVLGL